ncbi:MAG: HAD family phosphatase [Deltaproteobacteria bacterium]
MTAVRLSHSETPSPGKITAITFDLGNVLVKVDHLRFCRRLSALAGLSPQQVYVQVFESSLEPGYDTGRLASPEFYERVTAHFGVALDYARFRALWCDIFDPMEFMAAVVARLAPRFPLFLLSNTNSLHFDYILESFGDILQPFQAFILSYQVGSRKPEAAIYQALIQQTGHPPEKILFLDDKVTFVEAAREQGLVAWQFRTPQELRQDLESHGLW